jgi:K+-sensing histidine kinase KdpD
MTLPRATSPIRGILRFPGSLGGTVASRIRRVDPRGYVVAVVGPVIAVVAKEWFNTAVGGDVGFSVTWLAVILAAWLGGFGPGIVATVIGGTLEATIHAQGGAPLSTDLERTRFVLFIVDGLLLSAVAALARRGRHAADRARHEAEVHGAAADVAVGRMTALQALTADLSRARTTGQVAGAALDRGRRSIGANAGAVYLLAQDGRTLETTDAVGYEAADVHRWRRIPMDTPVPATEVVRTGDAVFLDGPGDYRASFPHGKPADRDPAGALAVLPLRVGGLVAGAIGWAWREAQPFDERQRDTIATVAALVGQALERSRLFENERSARESAEDARVRTEALGRLAADLAGAATRGDVIDALADRGRSVIGARGAVVGLVEDGGAVAGPDRPNALLRLHSIFGYPTYTGPHELPLDESLPMTDAIRMAEPVLIGDPDEYRARYPRIESVVGQQRSQALASVPIVIGSEVVGALAYSFDTPVRWSAAQRALLEAVSRLGAQAIERAGMYESEREARRLAEVDRQRAAVLAEAGRALGLTLESAPTVEAVARLALPTLGDLAIVDVVAGPAPRRTVASLAPADDLATAVIQSRPIDRGSDDPFAAVIRSGQILRREVDDAWFEHVISDEASRAAFLAMGIRRILSVPLVTHDGTIGAMTFATRDPFRAYVEADVATAAALAQRIARAIENVRLHLEVRRLAEREGGYARELESVIAAIGEGVLVIGQDGTVRSMNAAARRLLGDDVVSETELAAILDTRLPLRAAHGDTPMPSEHRVRGTDRWLELTAYDVGAPRPDARSAAVCVLRDVTAFRQGQGLREAFLSLLSHELRTPVTTIYAGATVLGRRDGRLPAETQREILADVGAEADRLYRLVEDLLVLARFDEGIALGHEPQLLQRLVPSVVAQEQARWPHVRFQVDVEPDLPTVGGDETAIAQVLRNLCSNAAKYSPPDTTVAVCVGAAPEGVAVRVLDEGTGLRADEADHLFDPFYRSPATAAMAGGAGIGLYVCRRLVDAMGGRIWGLSRATGGSEFGLSLPPYELPADEPDDDLVRLAAMGAATDGP